MSKESRLAKRQQDDLRHRIASLEARVKSAPNTLARERYSKELDDARRQLQRMK
jgi:hypothetical protein